MALKHYLTQVEAWVNETHAGLGRPVVVAMLTVKAKKLLLIVSPRGCGKSRVTSFIGQQVPDSLMQDRLSAAGLVYLQDILSGFNGVLLVDDIAKTQTSYTRITTITTIAELVHSHYICSNVARGRYEITNFYGAAIINIQPVLLRDLVRSNEWEASVQDKSLRYYHLLRPINPNPDPPNLKLRWGKDLNKVEMPVLTGKLAEKVMKVCESQWGLARQKEHLRDLLRAAAALDNRDKVTQADYWILAKLLRPLQIEKIVTDKRSFEADRELDANRLAILTEFATYGNFTLNQLSLDYKLSQGHCYRIMSKYAQDWVVVQKNPVTYAPSDRLRKELKEVGLV